MVVANPIRYKTKCKQCDLELVFEKSDIFIGEAVMGKSIEESFTRDFIKCPSCGDCITVRSFDGYKQTKYFTEC